MGHFNSELLALSVEGLDKASYIHTAFTGLSKVQSDLPRPVPTLQNHLKKL